MSVIRKKNCFTLRICFTNEKLLFLFFSYLSYSFMLDFSLFSDSAPVLWLKTPEATFTMVGIWIILLGMSYAS